MPSPYPNITISSSTDTVFRTHLNYIKCIGLLTNGLAITVNVDARPSSSLDLQRIAKFQKLANITKASIIGEKDACDKEHAYSQVAAPWIPVKCYYRLYYLESILLYLLSDNEGVFGNGGHKKARKGLKGALNNAQLTLSPNNAKLGLIIDWSTARSFRATSGSTIRVNYYLNSDCPKSLRKKIAEYVEHDWLQTKPFRDYRSNVARTAKNTELISKKITLLDYFYWMRIKANYRDVDFLDFDKDISEDDAYEYLTEFIKAGESYAQALEAAIVDLKQRRGIA